MGNYPFSAPASTAGLTVSPSGDTSGAKDAAAIMAAANSAWNSGGGIVTLASGQGPWYVEGGQVAKDLQGIPVYLQIGGTIIRQTGEGPCFSLFDSLAEGSREFQGGGLLGYGIIDGALTAGDAQAFYGGDIFQLALFLQAMNYNDGAGSAGVLIDNRYLWTEQAYGRILTRNCASSVIFDVSEGNGTNTGSIERCDLGIYTDQGDPTYDGVVFRNGAFIQDGKLGLYGNYGTSASPLTSATLRIDGATPDGVLEASVSNLSTLALDIGNECDETSGSNAPYTIFFGTEENSIVNPTGNWDFGASGAFTPSNNANQVIGMLGSVQGDPNLPAFLPASGTNIADGAQDITGTSPAVITNVDITLAAFTAYDVKIYLPHLGAGALGTFTAALAGDIFSASLDIKLWTGTVLTSHLQNSGSATLLAAAPIAVQRTLEVSGTIVLGTAGPLTLTGEITAGGSAVSIDAGASMTVIPSLAP
jgi:hypothetical protein